MNKAKKIEELIQTWKLQNPTKRDFEKVVAVKADYWHPTERRCVQALYTKVLNDGVELVYKKKIRWEPLSALNENAVSKILAKIEQYVGEFVDIGTDIF